MDASHDRDARAARPRSPWKPANYNPAQYRAERARGITSRQLTGVRARLLDFLAQAGVDTLHLMHPSFLGRRRELDREAHVSAEDAQARARPWFPRTHEDDGGTQGPRHSSRARAQASHRRLARQWSTPHGCGAQRTSQPSGRRGRGRAIRTSRSGHRRTTPVSCVLPSRRPGSSARPSAATVPVDACVRPSASSSKLALSHLRSTLSWQRGSPPTTLPSWTCARPSRRHSMASFAHEKHRSRGASWLQAPREPTAAAGVSLHADLLGVRGGGCRAPWRPEGHGARGEAAPLLQPVQSRWLRPGPIGEMWIS